MSDDETLPIEGSQVAKGVRAALECPVCMEYMVPPITMCSSGHSVCRDCKPRLSSCPTCRRPLTGTRNIALEHLARDMQLPQRATLASQLASCYDEDRYGCPLECPWAGRRTEIWKHVSETHCHEMLEGRGENSCHWELPLVVSDTRVIFAFGEVFLYRERLHTIKKMFYIVVQYVGPPEDSAKFKYEVEFCSSRGDQKVTVIGNITLGPQRDMDAVYETGSCVTLDYDVVKRMAEGNKLVYSVRVFKSSPAPV